MSRRDELRRERRASRLVTGAAAVGLVLFVAVAPRVEAWHEGNAWRPVEDSIGLSALALMMLLAGLAVGAAARSVAITGQRPWPLGPSVPWSASRVITSAGIMVACLAYGLVRVVLPAEDVRWGIDTNEALVIVEPIRAAAAYAAILVVTAITWELAYRHKERQEAAVAMGGAPA